MGFSPRQVDEMTLFEFHSCAEGYRKANSTEEPLPAPSAEKFSDMVERHKRLTAHT